MYPCHPCRPCPSLPVPACTCQYLPVPAVPAVPAVTVTVAVVVAVTVTIYDHTQWAACGAFLPSYPTLGGGADTHKIAHDANHHPFRCLRRNLTCSHVNLASASYILLSNIDI